ncbi:hypothetical protein WJX72_011529 [[Myrmecia] bisecta]|uniref:Matrin-type domain-containing protein n=1 Tax=[Myrmecia] bisecta TaxID=41462 RepID=A0AAW1RA24_9CHLO
MTEFWVSNKNHWCDYCKVWMSDNPNARATHERGMKHQENVARKLREMRQKTAADAQEKQAVSVALKSIESRAQQQFAEDLKAAQQALGDWVKHEESGYMYNEVQRYYFDSATGMYYGGDPPAWTLTPQMPVGALFGAASSHNSAANLQASTSTAGPAASRVGITKSSAGVFRNREMDLLDRHASRWPREAVF